MNTDNVLKSCLETWRSNFIEAGRAGDEPVTHLAEATLYRMALAAGLKEASVEDIKHLSLCPTCLRRWAEYRQAVEDVEESENFTETRVVAFGMLEAAADDKPKEAVRMKSPCGKFFLGLLPQMGDPEKGMITLECESSVVSDVEGRVACVRDINGRILLQGVLRQGRLARRIDRLSEINLANWTVVVD